MDPPPREGLPLTEENYSDVKSARLAAAALLVVPILSAPAAALSASQPRPTEAECTRKKVARLVTAFVTAYNRGNAERLERIWAQEPHFEWFSVERERQRPDPYDRATLGEYFSARHELSDRLRLRYLRVRPRRDSDDTFGFVFRLTRHSNEKRGRGGYHGKGSALGPESFLVPQLPDPNRPSSCVLHVWSMGRDT